MSKLSATEKVLFAFSLFTLAALILSPGPIQFSGMKWSVFPKGDLLFITFAVLTLKLNRGETKPSLAILLLSMLAYFGFTPSKAESILPVQSWIGEAPSRWLIHFKWIFLTSSISLFLFRLIKKNTSPLELVKQVRTIAPIILMPMLYPFIPLLIDTAHLPDQDEILHAIDVKLFFSHDPLVILDHLVHPALSEWMAFSYSFYGLFFLSTFALLFLKKEETPIQEFVFNSALTFSIGYWGYVLVPAKGPVFTGHFTNSLDLYYMKDIQYALMDSRRIDRDCFPSLHTAITFITLFSAWKHLRRFFWICLPFAGSIPVACVYLRYHYFIDIVAGAALAFFVIKTIPQLMRRYQKTSVTQDSP